MHPSPAVLSYRNTEFLILGSINFILQSYPLASCLWGKNESSGLEVEYGVGAYCSQYFTKESAVVSIVVETEMVRGRVEKVGSIGRGEALALCWGRGTSNQSKDDVERGV